MLSRTPLHTPSPADRLGFWAAAGAALTFWLFTFCFVAVALVNPPFIWTDMQHYVEYVAATQRGFILAAQTCMLLFGPLYVLALSALYERTPPERRVFVRGSLALAAAFAALSGSHYFVQISAVRLNLAAGATAGLEHWLQSRPYSAISALNILGWGLFLGLSSLLAAPAVCGGGRTRAVRLLLYANGVCCLVGGAAYVFDLTGLLFVALNFGMGGALAAATVLLALHFRTSA